MIRAIGSPLSGWPAMGEPPVIRLPALAGRQLGSWQALVELAPKLGGNWLLVGGQMVLMRELERGGKLVRDHETRARPTPLQAWVLVTGVVAAALDALGIVTLVRTRSAPLSGG